MRRETIVIVFVTFFFASCWNQQWEDRLASGDTESVTHGKNTPPDSKPRVEYCVDYGIRAYKERNLFNRWCASCHSESDRMLTGPGLHYVMSRIPNIDWGIAFIQNEDSLSKTGDTYTKRLNEASKTSYTHSFKKITKEEIKALLLAFK
jgi:hypothetical protein